MSLPRRRPDPFAAGGIWKHTIGVRLFIRSRASRSIVASWVIAVLLARRFCDVGFDVTFDSSRPPRILPALEVLAVVTGLVALLGSTPRFVEWERLGALRVRVAHTATVAAACLIMPQVVLAAGVQALPPLDPGDDWQWVSANALLITAAGVLLAALLGHLFATAALVALALTGIVVQQLLGPVVSWLPFASGPDPTPRWSAAAMVATGAIAVTLVRSGSAVLETARRHNEQ